MIRLGVLIVCVGFSIQAFGQTRTEFPRSASERWIISDTNSASAMLPNRVGVDVPLSQNFSSSKASRGSIAHNLYLLFQSNMGRDTPFWLQHNRYDLISRSTSAQLGLNYQGAYRITNEMNLFWQAELYGRSDEALNERSFHQLYGGFNYRNWLLLIGKREEQIGEVQYGVSSGPTIWSGNARPMPKVKLELTEFSPVPFTEEWISVKGGIAHGWFESGRVVEDFYLHEKYVYLKFGQDPWPAAYVGLIHMAQWGGYDNYELGQMPEGLDELWRVFLGAAGREGAPLRNRNNATGNHLGSWQVGIRWSIEQTDLLLNRSSIFEDGTGFKLWSPEDGLWGINVRQNHTMASDQSSHTLFTWEFWHTKTQSGRGLNDRPDDWEGDPRFDADGHRFGGRDNYFHHSVYRPGWSYHNRVLGVPFITIDPDMHRIENNRFIAHHLGVKHKESNWSVTVFYTWTKNYGTYWVPFEEPLTQHHGLISLERDLSDLLQFPVTLTTELGLDHGQYFGNRSGLLFTLIYRLL